ncbi:MAG: rod-binding protein [Thermodesulfobacteriota bacterium]|nr:rod-binding protein [Thermodesulfobacteriota bacterium]
MDTDIISQNLGQAGLEKLRRNSTKNQNSFLNQNSSLNQNITRNQSDFMNQTGSCIDTTSRDQAGSLNSKNSDTTENTELKEACQGFEAIFLNSLMKSMRTSLPGDGLFKESHGMGIYKSMYDRYLTEDIAKNSPGTGIGQYLYRQLQDQAL